jgi:hypothetical protein
MRYTVINTQEAPVDILKKIVKMKLKPVDEAECLHMGAKDTEEAIGRGLATSSYCKALIDDAGEPQAVFGVVDTPAGFAIPWLLTTSEHVVDKSWLRHCKYIIFPEMCEGRNFFSNVCFKDNTKTKRWLKWLGFKFMPYDETCIRFMMNVEAIEPAGDIIDV